MWTYQVCACSLEELGAVGVDRTVAQEATGLWGKEVCAWIAAEAEDLFRVGEE